MPRVSAEHLAARRLQIVDAALACFGRNGFHATTMADVIAESGLSAGAVYRYFRSKDELIEAIADRVVGVTGDALADLLAGGGAPDPATVLRRLLPVLDGLAGHGEADLRRMALQVWAEALRSEPVMVIARTAQERLRALFVEVARHSQAAGRLPSGADPVLVGQALQSLLLGFVVQHLLLGDTDADRYADGVEALLATGAGLPVTSARGPGEGSA